MSELGKIYKVVVSGVPSTEAHKTVYNVEMFNCREGV